jgi:hypothetical protein
MLSFRVLPRSILDTGTNADLPESGPSGAPHPSSPSAGQTVCKIVTLTAPMDPTGTFYPLSFQSLVGPFSPSSSHGTRRIPFNFLPLRMLSIATDGYTPLPPLHRAPISFSFPQKSLKYLRFDPVGEFGFHPRFQEPPVTSHDSSSLPRHFVSATVTAAGGFFYVSK